jgi:uncharacterized protein (TIGR00730 family)
VVLKSVCVFCGSNPGTNPVYIEAANQVGRVLAQHSLRLVYGGGRVGLMGAIADAAIEFGGEVIGVIPRVLLEKELGHDGVTELIVVGSMHERKALMAEYADAFIALPGGFGTFEEFCEVLTWTQLGLHAKPCGLLNVNQFYDPLLSLFDSALDDGFVRPEHRSLVLADSDIASLLDRLSSFSPAPKNTGMDHSKS